MAMLTPSTQSHQSHQSHRSDQSTPRSSTETAPAQSIGSVPAAPPLADDELIRHLSGSFSLSTATALRLVEEVLHYYSETPAEFVTRLHTELQRQGWSNNKIYAHIEAVLPSRRFASPPLTTRQIRRVIYG